MRTYTARKRPGLGGGTERTAYGYLNPFHRPRGDRLALRVRGVTQFDRHVLDERGPRKVGAVPTPGAAPGFLGTKSHIGDEE